MGPDVAEGGFKVIEAVFGSGIGNYQDKIQRDPIGFDDPIKSGQAGEFICLAFERRDAGTSNSTRNKKSGTEMAK